MIDRALIIGAGIAGIQAALDIANSGYEVVLVEREPSIGGHMAQLSETFPTLDCSQCIMTPRMVEVRQHPNIHLYTYSEVEEVNGYIGNFDVKIKKKARSVDLEKCYPVDFEHPTQLNLQRHPAQPDQKCGKSRGQIIEDWLLA